MLNLVNTNIDISATPLSPRDRVSTTPMSMPGFAFRPYAHCTGEWKHIHQRPGPMKH